MVMKIKSVKLEDKVIYDPVTHSIYKIDDGGSQTTLPIPASLCLFMLLENKGEVVSHRDLLAFAWESRGMMVSPNTLYQNMSVLRKALGASGISDDMIKTVPKRGFVIPEVFPVTFIYDQDEQPQNPEPDNKMQSDELTLPAPAALEKTLNFQGKYGAFAVACFAVFFVTWFISTYLGRDKIPQYIYPDYVKLENLEDCQVFRNYSLRENSFFTQFLAEINIKCGKEKWWYITNYPPSDQISLLRCSTAVDDKKTTNTSLCVSDFYNSID